MLRVVDDTHDEGRNLTEFVDLKNAKQSQPLGSAVGGSRRIHLHRVCNPTPAKENTVDFGRDAASFVPPKCPF